LDLYYENNKDIISGAVKILFELGNLKKHEKLCIITDSNTERVGKIFYEIANKNMIKTEFLKIKPFNVHGEEPPKFVKEKMLNSDLILGLTTNSMAHTNARLEAAKNGIRYLSLPQYYPAILADVSLRTDFKRCGKRAKIMAENLTKGKSVQLITAAGTNLQLDVNGRNGNFCPGYVNENILLGSPPDIEANVSTIEDRSNGIIVVDGSIPITGLGKMKTSIVLKVNNGKIISIKGKEDEKQFLENLFGKYGSESKILAEIGFGYNEMARISGNMLIDEGTYGTAHFGFGSNFSLGGINKVNFHLDFVINANEVIIDGNKISI